MSTAANPYRRDVLLLTFGKNQVGYLQWMFRELSSSAANVLVGEMKQQREAEKDSLLLKLKCCSMRRDLQWGKRIHVKAVESEHDSNIYVRTALIRMYAKCGSMVDARLLFDSIQKPDVVSWNVLLLGYVENGDGLTALNLFSMVKAVHGCVPNPVTYVAALKACISLAVKRGAGGQYECLKRGRAIHSEIGCHLDLFVQNTLIDMYAKCGNIADAHRVFDNVQKPDIVSWNVLLLGYTENGNGLSVLEVFASMKARGCAPNSITYVAALKACIMLAMSHGQSESLKRGSAIHCEIDCHLDVCLQSTLIEMYSKCGSMKDARLVFDNIHKPHVVSWNALLQGYVGNGDGLTALDLFSEMKAVRAPKPATYVAALKACTSLVNPDGNIHGECLKRGREIHFEIGHHLDHYVQSALMEMYSKCSSMGEARLVFDSIRKPDVVCWNVFLLGYAENEEGVAALELFSRMKASGCEPDSVTYAAALKACTCLAVNGDDNRKGVWLERGRDIHFEIGLHLNLYVQNTLIDMYSKCGSMTAARQVFDSIQIPDIVSWNALILGYADNGQGLSALKLFSRMKTTPCAPDSTTYVAALKACTSLAVNADGIGKTDFLICGREIHSKVDRHLNIYVQSALINMYFKCGSIVDARHVFDSIQKPNVVCWNKLLLGYAEKGDGLATLELFSRMKACGCAPDSVTYIAALKSCGLVGALPLGRTVHSEISNFTAPLVTCLVNFYARCGTMIEARKVFDLHTRARVVPTWNALLAGHASFGDTASVFSLFEEMKDQGFHPDAFTFVCILSCCRHAGLVEKAREYFEAMPTYGVTPTVIHCNCFIDILGRANQLNEAITVLRKMSCNPDAVTWKTLLGACCKLKNVEIGKWAIHQSLVAR